MCVYSNAADVLPPDLLRKVQKHWRGLLYVPPPASVSTRNEGTDIIRSMILSGTPVSEIAAFAGITPRRVYQIARTLGPENPYHHPKVTEKVTEV